MLNCKQIKRNDLLGKIAKETAGMASPGHFYGAVVGGRGIKMKVIDFFSEFERFPIGDLWDQNVNQDSYKRWHKKQIKSLRGVIEGHIVQLPNHSQRTTFAVAAKLLDTFMHQLMKYDRFRYLYNALYLPLDRRALQKISRPVIHGVEIPRQIHNLALPYIQNPYAIYDEQYYKIQKKLNELLDLLNNILPNNCQLQARIELNCLLWA